MNQISQVQAIECDQYLHVTSLRNHDPLQTQYTILCDLLWQNMEQVASDKRPISHLVQINTGYLDQYFQFVKDVLL